MNTLDNEVPDSKKNDGEAQQMKALIFNNDVNFDPLVEDSRHSKRAIMKH